MESSRNYKKLEASSILESVIAIAIISICILVAFMVYVNVISQNKPTSYFKAQHQVEKIYQEAKLSRDYEDNDFKFSDYSISKNVIVDREENIAIFTFVIQTVNKSYSIKRIYSLNEN